MPGLEGVEFVIAVDTKDVQARVVSELMRCHDDHVFAVLRNNRLALSSRELDCLEKAGVTVARDTGRPASRPATVG